MNDRPIFTFHSKEAEVAYQKLGSLVLTERSKALIAQGEPGQGYVYFLDLENGEIDLIPAYNKNDGKTRKAFMYEGNNYTVESHEPLGSSTGIVHTTALALIHKSQKQRMLAAGGIFLWNGEYLFYQFRNKSASQNTLTFKYDETYLLCCYKPYKHKHENPLLVIQRSIPSKISMRILDAICSQLPPREECIMQAKNLLIDNEMEGWYLSLSKEEIENTLKDNLFISVMNNDIDITMRILSLRDEFPSLSANLRNQVNESLLDIAIRLNLSKMMIMLIDSGAETDEAINHYVMKILYQMIRDERFEEYELLKKIQYKTPLLHHELLYEMISTFLNEAIKNRHMKQIIHIQHLMEQDPELKSYLYKFLLNCIKNNKINHFILIAEIDTDFLDYAAMYMDSKDVNEVLTLALKQCNRMCALKMLRSDYVSIEESAKHFSIYHLEHSMRINDFELFSLVIALKDKIPEMLKKLVGKDLAVKKHLFKAASINQTDFVLEMLKLNDIMPELSINMVNNKHQTLLDIAVKNKNHKLAAHLIELGASYNSKTKRLLEDMGITFASDSKCIRQMGIFQDKSADNISITPNQPNLIFNP